MLVFVCAKGCVKRCLWVFACRNVSVEGGTQAGTAGINADRLV